LGISFSFQQKLVVLSLQQNEKQMMHIRCLSDAYLYFILLALPQKLMCNVILSQKNLTS